MLKKLQNAIKTGFFHIIITNFLNRIVEFGSGIILVRILSKNEYGIYSYAYNIITIFLLVNGLGMNSGMLQFGSELAQKDPERKKGIFRFGIMSGLKFDVFLALALVLTAYIIPMKIEGVEQLLRIMCIYPLLLFVVENVQIYLRVSMDNKRYGNYNLLCSIVGFLMTIIGAKLLGMQGVVLFKYLGFILLFCFGFAYADGYAEIFTKKVLLPLKQRWVFTKYSVLVTIDNAFSQLIYTIDVFLVGMLISDAETVAMYKTATIIPFGLSFIPVSFAVYLYPYIAGNLDNKRLIRKYAHQMMLILAGLNIVISFILFLGAPLIIRIFFGEAYNDAVIPFRILAVGYFFSGTFRSPLGNVLAAMRRVKFNLCASVIGGILNILVDIFLIIKMGTVGAAIATTIIYVFISVVEVFYFEYVVQKEG